MRDLQVPEKRPVNRMVVLHRLLKSYDQRLDAVENCRGITDLQRDMMREEIIITTREALDTVPEEILLESFGWYVVYTQAGIVAELRECTPERGLLWGGEAEAV